MEPYKSDSDRVCELIEENGKLKRELAEAMAWVRRLQAGGNYLCSFCGHSSMPGALNHSHQDLVDHVNICEKHPMAALKKRIAELESNDD